MGWLNSNGSSDEKLKNKEASRHISKYCNPEPDRRQGDNTHTDTMWGTVEVLEHNKKLWESCVRLRRYCFVTQCVQSTGCCAGSVCVQCSSPRPAVLLGLGFLAPIQRATYHRLMTHLQTKQKQETPLYQEAATCHTSGWSLFRFVLQMSTLISVLVDITKEWSAHKGWQRSETSWRNTQDNFKAILWNVATPKAFNYTLIYIFETYSIKASKVPGDGSLSNEKNQVMTF